MAYADADTVFADADAKIELARQLLGRVQPIEGSPAELYVVKVRKIPAEAVAACPDLAYLPSPIEGRPVVDHGLVSLLRDTAGETSGLQIEFVDILDRRRAEQADLQLAPERLPRRVVQRRRERRCRLLV